MNQELKQVIGQSANIRNRIIKECRIHRSTYCNWLSGKNPIPFWAEEKIDAIMSEVFGKSWKRKAKVS